MIQAENELPAETWFFKIIVRLDDDRDFSDVLNARKQHLECSLSTVTQFHWLHARNHSLNIWELEELSPMLALVTGQSLLLKH